MTRGFGKTEIGRFIQGDEEVFNKVFQSYYPPLVAYTTSFISDKEEAREIVQEVFLKLWEKKASLHPDTNLKAYLFSIARNLCINHLDHKRIGQKYTGLRRMEILTTELNHLVLTDPAAEELYMTDLRERIQELLQRLPDQNRKVFEMHRNSNLTYKEISQQLNISVKAVEAHISRALRYLKENLPEYF
jgi:RNA polymerase sigma-70 factor, ECF subfamily